MTPGARVAAAIDVVAEMQEGLAAEQALTRWARRSRYAGSKDRAAVRDRVFDLLRMRASAAHYGKGDSPRALMIGMLHATGADLDALFTGEGHAPQPLTDAEHVIPEPPHDPTVRWNLPEWLVPVFGESLGTNAEKTALLLQERAPVFLRVNPLKCTVSEAQERLASEQVLTAENSLADMALTVTDGARRIRNSGAYQEGWVELQDTASQAVAAAVPAGGRVLDYCAGGGGKALALAADPGRTVFAHDIDRDRMRDLPGRAARAGVQIALLSSEEVKAARHFNTVLCDAPCSGSGAWRRSPEGKWALTPERLEQLCGIQDSILDQAATLVAENGTLAYATCSVLRVENEARVAAFLARHPGWTKTHERRFDVSALGDGFYTAHLKRA